MKLLDLVILFVLITLPFSLISDSNTRHIEEVLYSKSAMNRILDTAVEDGVTLLVERGLGEHIKINKEKCVKAFYNTLYMNLGIIDDPYDKARLAGYIPIIAIVDYDGLYLLANETFVDDGGYFVIMPVWQPKIMFAYTKNQFVYGFSLEDDVTLYDLSNGMFYKGKQIDIKRETSAELLQDDILFDQVRRRTIVETLQREMMEYINRHNEVARQYGITYQFSLPTIEKEEWQQTIDDIGMIAFFQGMPLGAGGAYYNDFAFGGAKINKSDGYFIEVDSNNGLAYYHRESCKFLTDKSKGYNNQSKCALEGAFPCDYCKP